MSGSAGSLHLFDQYYSSSATDHFYTSNPSGENLDAYSFSASNVWTAFMGSSSKGIVGSVEALWRYYNDTIDDHYFSRSSTVHLTFTDWVREGAVGYVYGSNGSNRFAVYSHWDGSTDHKFTTNSSEPGYTAEGVAWYSPSIVSGCGDSSANNYDPYVNQSNTGCNYTVYGCTDSSADNYNSSANTDDGSCTYSGCTDPNANNYDSNADTDDGSCTYTPEFDHGFRLTSAAPNGAFSDNITVNEGVQFQIKLDWSKANDIKNTGYLIGWEFQETDGVSTASNSDFSGSISAEYAINSNSGYVTYNRSALEDITTEGTEVMRVAFYTRTSSTASKAYYAAKTVTISDTSVQIDGCTDVNAWNYDSNANTDDGSCRYYLGDSQSPTENGYIYSYKDKGDTSFKFVYDGGSSADATRSFTWNVSNVVETGFPRPNNDPDDSWTPAVSGSVNVPVGSSSTVTLNSVANGGVTRLTYNFNLIASENNNSSGGSGTNVLATIPVRVYERPADIGSFTVNGGTYQKVPLYEGIETFDSNRFGVQYQWSHPSDAGYPDETYIVTAPEGSTVTTSNYTNYDVYTTIANATPGGAASVTRYTPFNDLAENNQVGDKFDVYIVYKTTSYDTLVNDMPNKASDAITISSPVTIELIQKIEVAFYIEPHTTNVGTNGQGGDVVSWDHPNKVAKVFTGRNIDWLVLINNEYDEFFIRYKTTSSSVWSTLAPNVWPANKQSDPSVVTNYTTYINFPTADTWDVELVVTPLYGPDQIFSYVITAVDAINVGMGIGNGTHYLGDGNSYIGIVSHVVSGSVASGQVWRHDEGVTYDGTAYSPVIFAGVTGSKSYSPKSTTQYVVKAYGEGNDLAKNSVDIDVLIPVELHYFRVSQNPVTPFTQVTFYWNVTGDGVTDIQLDGTSVYSGPQDMVGSATRTINTGKSYILNVIHANGTESENIIVQSQADISANSAYTFVYDSYDANGYDLLIPGNANGVVITAVGASGGDGGPDTFDGITSYGSYGSPGAIGYFNYPGFGSKLLKIYPGQVGQTLTSSCTNCNATGGAGLISGGNSGSTRNNSGPGGGGGGATVIIDDEDQEFLVAAGGGGGGAGGTRGTIFPDSGGNAATVSTINAFSAASNPSVSTLTNGQSGSYGFTPGASESNLTAGGGGGGGGLDGPGGVGGKESLEGTGSIATGGSPGLSKYNDAKLDIIGSGPAKKRGDGYVIVSYNVGSAGISSFSVTPVVNIGSNIFELSWSTFSIASVEVWQTNNVSLVSGTTASGDPITSMPEWTLISVDLNNSGLEWNSELQSNISAGLSPAVDTFVINAYGQDSTLYTQSISVQVYNDTQLDISSWDTTHIAGPEEEVILNLGTITGVDTSVFIYGGGNTKVGSSPGSFATEKLFSSGDDVYIKYQNPYYNLDVTDGAGNRLTGEFGNENSQILELYVGGDWFPTYDGATAVFSASGPGPYAGKGELGGFITPDNGSMILMGTYGVDTPYTPTRTVTWSIDAANGGIPVDSLKITHISGTNDNGGDMPVIGGRYTPEDGETLWLVIDKGDGSTPREINLVPNYESTYESYQAPPYRIAGNTPSYFPCVRNTPFSGTIPSSHNLVGWNFEYGGAITACYWQAPLDEKWNYEIDYGVWGTTTVILNEDEQINGLILTIKSVVESSSTNWNQDYNLNTRSSSDANYVTPEQQSENPNAGRVHGISSVVTYDSFGDQIKYYRPGINKIFFDARTYPPVIREDFDIADFTQEFPSPDIDVVDNNPLDYLVVPDAGAMTINDIDLVAQDEVLEIRSDDPDVQVRVNTGNWTNVKKIGDP